MIVQLFLLGDKPTTEHVPRPFLAPSKVLLEEYVCNNAETREKHLKGAKKNRLKEENKISIEGKLPLRAERKVLFGSLSKWENLNNCVKRSQ